MSRRLLQIVHGKEVQGLRELSQRLAINAEFDTDLVSLEDLTIESIGGHLSVGRANARNAAPTHFILLATKTSQALVCQAIYDAYRENGSVSLQPGTVFGKASKSSLLAWASRHRVMIPDSVTGWGPAVSERIYTLGDTVILKPAAASKGLGVFVASLADAQDFCSSMDATVVAQRFLPNTCDYRVYILGGRVRGGIKRVRKYGLLNNLSLGAQAHWIDPEELPPAVGDLANHIALVGPSYVGIDVVEHANRAYLLEQNTAFQILSGALSSEKLQMLASSIHDAMNSTV